MIHSVKSMVEGSPAIKDSTLVYTEHFTLDKGGILNLYDNLDAEDCELITQANCCHLIQFARGFINADTLQLINSKILTSRPHIQLRVNLNGESAFSDLQFLQHLSNLKDLNVDFYNVEDASPISKYLQLHTLGIGGNKVSFKPILEQKLLKKLSVGDRPKHINLIGEMPWLERLHFFKHTSKDLDFLIPLASLRELSFMLGGTTNLQALPEIGQIENLSFTMVRKLTIDHLLSINDMKHLQKLSFDTQPHLTDLDWLKLANVQTSVISCKNFNVS